MVLKHYWQPTTKCKQHHRYGVSKDPGEHWWIIVTSSAQFRHRGQRPEESHSPPPRPPPPCTRWPRPPRRRSPASPGPPQHPETEHNSQDWSWPWLQRWSTDLDCVPCDPGDVLHPHADPGLLSLPWLAPLPAHTAGGQEFSLGTPIFNNLVLFLYSLLTSALSHFTSWKIDIVIIDDHHKQQASAY